MNEENDPHICCPPETHCKSNETHRLKMRGWKNVSHANGNKKKTGVAIFVLTKIDIKTKPQRDKEEITN